jgi:hypothetical protein
MTKESSSSDESAAAKKCEVRFEALGGLESGRPVLVRRVVEAGAAPWEGLDLAGVRREIPGVGGWS